MRGGGQLRRGDPEPWLALDGPVFRDGGRGGRIASGMYGHTVGGAWGMAYVGCESDTPRAAVIEGTFEVSVNGVLVPATASYRPFYDPDSLQVRL